MCCQVFSELVYTGLSPRRGGGGEGGGGRVNTSNSLCRLIQSELATLGKANEFEAACPVAIGRHV